MCLLASGILVDHNVKNSHSPASDEDGYCKLNGKSFQYSVLAQSKPIEQISDKGKKYKNVGKRRSIATTVLKLSRLVRLQTAPPEEDCNNECDALMKISPEKFGRKKRDRKTVHKSKRVRTTSPLSDSDIVEPTLKRSTKKDDGNKAEENVLSSSYSNTHPTTLTGANQRQENVQKTARLANTTSDADISPLRKSARIANRVHNLQVLKLTHEEKELKVFTNSISTAEKSNYLNLADDDDDQLRPGPSFSLSVDFTKYGPLPVIPSRKLDKKDDEDQSRPTSSVSLCVDFTKYGLIPVIPN